MTASPAATQAFTIPWFDDSEIQAGFSLHDTSQPLNYSMRRPGEGNEPSIARSNLYHFAEQMGFDVRSLVMARRWPHLSRVRLLVDSRDTVPDDRNGSLNPKLWPSTGPEAEFLHSCDGLVTQNPSFILGVQSGGCRGVWLHDPNIRAIGLLHCGWKGLARGIIANAITVFKALGSQPHDIRAYIGPGEGDDEYEFRIDERSEPILWETGMFNLFSESLRPMAGRPGRFSLPENWITQDQLENAGLSRANIYNDQRSGILDPTLPSSRRARTEGDPVGGWLNVGFMRLL